MKKVLKMSVVIFTMILGISLLSACEKDDQASQNDASIKDAYVNGGSGNCACLENAPASITPEEEEMLIFMREEEKLARDVYLVLYDQYNEVVFNNIASSEQRHMDRVLCFLEHYGLEDPASTEIGVFNNNELQQLYNELTTQGSTSLVDALIVGATIEDVDIYDLENYLTQASNEAIITMFNHLVCGSRNHLRAFSGLLLETNGALYTPQYITQDQYDEIIASSHEKCGNGNGRGNVNGNGNGNNNSNCNGSGNGSGNGGNGNGGNCPGSGTGGGNNGNGGNGGNNGNGGVN